MASYGMKIEGKGRRGRRRKQLMNELKEMRGYLISKNGTTISHFVENSLSKRLWICRKTDRGKNGKPPNPPSEAAFSLLVFATHLNWRR